jgi:hypothetical protein
MALPTGDSSGLARAMRSWSVASST